MKPDEGLYAGATYLRRALATTAEEQAVRRSLLDRLPVQIFDAHAHASTVAHVGVITEFGWTQARSSFPAWPLEQSRTVHEFLYGDRKVNRVWMAQPYLGIDHRAVNAYLSEMVAAPDLVALYGLPDDREYTLRELGSGRYAALKMYPHYREPAFQLVAEYFPDWVLEAAQAAGVTVILHLPEPLADCLREVDEVMQRYPRLRVVLAHLGRHSWVDARTADAFERASRHGLLAMDTSMAASQPVHELALRTFGPTRILFGSDEPFNLLRYVPVIDPDLGRHNVSWEPYHWSEVLMHARHRHRAKGALLLHFQVLQALLGAIKNTFPTDEQEVTEHVFWRNGNGWFGATPS